MSTTNEVKNEDIDTNNQQKNATNETHYQTKTLLDEDKKDQSTKISAKCEGTFYKCEPAKRIKIVLTRYNRIICDKKEKSEHILQNETNELMNNISPIGEYTHKDLINDFYHIKYGHDVNENPIRFDLFYEYLFSGDNVLQCDINYCKTAKRYYQRRNMHHSVIDLDDREDATPLHWYSLHLISTIHTYFVHEYEISQLSNNEIQFIEKQLQEFKADDDDSHTINDKKLQLISAKIKDKRKGISFIHEKTDNSKFITNTVYVGNVEKVNYSNISSLLEDRNIFINGNVFAKVFDRYTYHKQQMIDEVCVIMLNDNDANTLIYK
eukprot:70279_1